MNAHRLTAFVLLFSIYGKTQTPFTPSPQPTQTNTVVLRPGVCTQVRPGTKIQVPFDMTFAPASVPNGRMQPWFSFSSTVPVSPPTTGSLQSVQALSLGLAHAEIRRAEGRNDYIFTGIIQPSAFNGEYELTSLGVSIESSDSLSRLVTSWASPTVEAQSESKKIKVCVTGATMYQPPTQPLVGKITGVGDPR